jgi:hypothetical protein
MLAFDTTAFGAMTPTSLPQSTSDILPAQKYASSQVSQEIEFASS